MRLQRFLFSSCAVKHGTVCICTCETPLGAVKIYAQKCLQTPTEWSQPTMAKNTFCGSRTGGFCDVDYGTNAGFLKGKTQLSGKGNIGIVKCPIRGVRMYGNKSSKHKADNSDCVDSQRAELRCGRVFPTLCLSAAISDTVYIRRSCDTLCYGS